MSGAGGPAIHVSEPGMRRMIVNISLRQLMAHLDRKAMAAFRP